TSVWISSAGRANVLTSLPGPPSTLRVAMPILRPRLPIQRMEVPMNVIVAVAPAAFVCTAEPPLQPRLESLLAQVPVNLIAASDSSTRMPAVGSDCVGVPGEGVPMEASPPPPPPQEANRNASNRMDTRAI